MKMSLMSQTTSHKTHIKNKQYCLMLAMTAYPENICNSSKLLTLASDTFF